MWRQLLLTLRGLRVGVIRGEGTIILLVVLVVSSRREIT
jgi:hypothetical protein